VTEPRDPPSDDEDLRALIARSKPLEHAPAQARARVLLAVLSDPAVRDGQVSRSDSGRVSSIRRVTRIARSNRVRTSVRVILGLVAAALVAVAAVRVARERTSPEPSTSRLPPGLDKPERAVPQATAPPSPAPSAPVPVLAPSAGPSGPASSPAATPASPRTAPSALAPNQLELERQLLDGARSALARGQGSRALELTKEHERTFRRGILAQEREALAVRALLSLGRVDEARARTERFRRSYPDSVLGPTLESMLEAAGSR